MNAPTTIGQFEIRHLLGSGGFGHVYAAVDSELGRWVAIKALRPEIGGDPALVERFRAEGVSLARLNHTNITTLYGLQRDRQQLFLVMELVNGTTLEAALASLRRLGQTETLAVLAQAAAGLAYAHRMGVIHRDIKPANIMLTDTGILKIMDFGIARIRGTQRLTKAGLLGTYAYLAPEQFSRAEGDERSDLYSLACVVYEMLTGDIPFPAETEAAMMRGHLEVPPTPPRTRLPDLDPAIDAAVLRALAKDPAERFASVDLFSAAMGATALERQAPDIVRDRVLALMPAQPRPTTLIDTTGTGRFGSAGRRDGPASQAGDAGRGRWAARLPALVLGGVVTGLAIGAALLVWQWPGPVGSWGAGEGAPAPPATGAVPGPDQAAPVTPPTGQTSAAQRERTDEEVFGGTPPTGRISAAPEPRPRVIPHVPEVFPPLPNSRAAVQPPEGAPPAQVAASAGHAPVVSDDGASGGCGASLRDLPVTEIIVHAHAPDSVLCEALRRLGSGRVPDADLLLETAALKMHYVPALAALARRYDPVQPHPAGVQPDARRSARYYREAARNGDGSVAAARDALRADLEQRANGGDSNASIILSNFWP